MIKFCYLDLELRIVVYVEDMIQISLNCRRLLKARVLSSLLTGRMRISREMTVELCRTSVDMGCLVTSGFVFSLELFAKSSVSICSELPASCLSEVRVASV